MAGGGGAMMCKEKFVFPLFASFLILTAFASVSAAKTIYVPDDYLTIQSAVNAASPGDTIIVRDGLYKEHVIVNKQLTIKSERGYANCVVNGEGSDVFALYADGIRIEGFTITGGRHGIFINSNNNSIFNNNISSNNEDGIYIPSSSNNIISDNIISNNDNGIYLWYSNNNCISDNIISNNNNGTYLYHSNNNSISNNNILNNYNPYYYGINAGIYLEHSNGTSISNNNISNNMYGIFLWYSNKTSILNNNISDNRYGEVVGGIFLWYSNKTGILNNNISNNVVGICILYSNDNSISNNNISSNFGGISGWLYSSNNIITNNNISNNGYGIGLEGNNNSILNNNICSNYYGGVGISGSNNIISNNIICSNCYEISNDCAAVGISFGSNNIISNNIICSNKWEGLAYAIFLYDSNNNSILNNNILNNDYGIYFDHSNNNTILNNSISNNDYDGIRLADSDNNSISKNNISSNNWYGGIRLDDSNNNIIYLNNFINNTNNVYSYNSTNIWNSTEKITYTYRGSEFTNYMGNYWDDYTGSDADEDGIGDAPYSINADKDDYPLIEGFENYFVPTPTPTPAQTFDTGRPENPYPSISGEFIGTIRTNTKIIATKLYTYACEGTGGHTEHAIICNSSWCAYAGWEGYKEDWMNISFNRTVVLMPYETYNITIVTGSYPQIHHTHSLKTENGWINCTEFTDANGKKYNDWIPAIMLWS